jgi:hypothetical protein
VHEYSHFVEVREAAEMQALGQKRDPTFVCVLRLKRAGIVSTMTMIWHPVDDSKPDSSLIRMLT